LEDKLAIIKREHYLMSRLPKPGTDNNIRVEDMFKDGTYFDKINVEEIVVIKF
jgi:hypothetical protein